MTAGPAGKPSSAGLGTFGLLWPHALPSLFLRAGGGGAGIGHPERWDRRTRGGAGTAEELGWGCR